MSFREYANEQVTGLVDSRLFDLMYKSVEMDTWIESSIVSELLNIRHDHLIRTLKKS